MEQSKFFSRQVVRNLTEKRFFKTIEFVSLGVSLWGFHLFPRLSGFRELSVPSAINAFIAGSESLRCA